MEDQARSAGQAVDEAAEESHEALWTSLSTVIVSDKTHAPVKRCTVEDSSDSDCESSHSESARPAKHGTTREKLDPDQAPDSDGSTSDSGSSAPCKVVDVEEESLNAKGGVTLADLLGGASSDAAQQPSAAAVDSELRQGGDEDGARLPSVKRAQKQLQEIMSRRSTISAISSKYSPAMAAGCSKERTAATPPGPAQCPPAAPPMPKGAEVDCYQDKVDIASLGPSKVDVAAPLTSEHAEAEGGAKTTRTGAVGARPVRMSGRSARPDRAQVSDVLRQLGAGLNGLGARSPASQNRADGAGQGVDVSEPLAACCITRAWEEAAPLQAGNAAGLPGTAPAQSNRSATPLSDNFVGIVDNSSEELAAAKAAWPAEDAATSTGSSGSSAPVSSVASRYLVSDEAASAACARESEQLRSARPGAGRLEGSTQAWPIETKKLQEGRKREESRKEELWHQFLAGNDDPVGSDLPSPESYHGFGPS